ncbi:potassium channel subfamily K member 10-like [Macrobrachium nipponense]|uniref:potassium channel subfamily K member 10-like n=1 Tax=Macrobrachium nipponense TaxID=159736 RepID=UPI0030C800F9
MMSYRQWFVLFLIYLVFMLVGSVVFMYLEVDNELADRQELQDLKRKVIDVVSNLPNATKTDVEAILLDVGHSCDHDFLHLVEDEPLTWSLWNSFFFTFTVITTIGFGHMSPATAWGKIFCILYATVGVPLNGIVIATLADFFSAKVVNSRVRARAKRYQSSWLAVAADTICYLLPGFVVFLVIPAAILVAVEKGWDYLDSFYYAFITLTTIGFGDYVSGRQETDYVLVWLYKIISFFWIIFGLGYIIVTITFIQKALKSKKVHNIERRMAKVLKKHANKMNSNVHHDLKRLRKVVNTISEMRDQDDYPQDGEKARNQSEEKMRQKEKLALELETEQDATSHDRAFYSHQNSPYSIRESLKRTRSSSDAGIPLSKSEGFLASNSLGNFNMFLDMVETLLREHEADAAKRADDEARQFMDDTSSREDSSSENSDEEPLETPTDEKKQRDAETGFINFVCTGDDDKIIFEKDGEKPPQKSDEAQNSQLHRKLSTFLGIPTLSNDVTCVSAKSLPNDKITKASDLIGMMESFVNHQSVPDQYDTFTGLVKGTNRGVSSTVPGRYRFITECENRVHLKDVFQTDAAAAAVVAAADPDGKTQGEVSNSQDQDDPKSSSSSASPAYDGRRWSVSDPCASQNSKNGEILFQERNGIKSEPFRLPKWVHSESDQENKSDSEDSSPDYSRL